MNDLPSRIRTYRKSLGLTQEELAQKAGIAQEFISGIEKGRKRPSIEVLEKLCGALGCSADYLLGLPGEGSKNKRMLKEENPSLALSPEILAEIAERHLTEEDLRLALKVVKVMKDDKMRG